MDSGENREWKILTSELTKAHQKDPKATPLSQFQQDLLASHCMLVNGAAFINSVLHRQGNPRALPLSAWEKHQAMTELGLGPPPDSAFMAPLPKHLLDTEKHYTQKAIAMRDTPQS